MTDLQAFVDRYVAVWNERDAGVRRAIIEGLWAPDGVEFTEGDEYRGHDAIEKRIVDAHEELVVNGGFAFHGAGDVLGHHGAITFRTTMNPADGGDSVWTGLVFVLLDEDGRIRQDHQFTAR